MTAIPENLWDAAWKNFGYLKQLCDMEDDRMEDELIKGFLAEAYRYAAEYSTDPSTQNGAILIHPSNHYVNEDGAIVNMMGYPALLVKGANHFPKGVKESEERWQRPQKYQYVEHAERNCIYAAAAEGTPTHNKWMVCPWFACADCARAIIQAKIKRVIGHQTTIDWTPEHWKESIAVALNMLEEAGVECFFWTGKVFENDEVKIRFNGELRSP